MWSATVEVNGHHCTVKAENLKELGERILQAQSMEGKTAKYVRTRSGELVEVKPESEFEL